MVDCFCNAEAVFAQPIVLVAGACTHHMLLMYYLFIHLAFAILYSHKVLCSGLCVAQWRHFLDQFRTVEQFLCFLHDCLTRGLEREWLNFFRKFSSLFTCGFLCELITQYSGLLFDDVFNGKFIELVGMFTLFLFWPLVPRFWINFQMRHYVCKFILVAHTTNC